MNQRSEKEGAAVLTVHTARPYDILVGSGLLDRAGALSREVNGGTRALIVTDSHVGPLYARRVARSLEAAGYRAGEYVFPAGETSKRLAAVEEIYAALAAGGFTRADLIVALGGGVAGDMAGFAAATWLRGIDFVQIPTSLLAQVDSSVGGKTGVDIPQGKNLVGAFWQPVRVLADMDTLDTLPAAFHRDGLGEVVKYACIAPCLCGGEPLFDRLERGDALSPGKRAETILACIDCKRGVVERDEREAGERRLLNFGHTLGHALEKYYDYAGPTHGCAVAVGMAAVTAASEREGLTAPGTTARLTSLLAALGLPCDDPAPPSAYLPAAAMDKKRAGDGIHLVLLRRMGEAFVHRLPMAELEGFVLGSGNAR
ncbi:MAG TPA: 3-dehydroquinate synthase [Firmicutes bacterium]|nr:3-dehydroquinate synthase [Bacillota bacterium]